MAGGYDCNFAVDIKLYECPVCLLVMRDPHIVDCCGKKYCKSCIEQIKGANRNCPVCNQRFTICLLEKELQRAISDLNVYCTWKCKGCEWRGELRHLQKHEKEECPHVVINCPLNCGASFKRNELPTHVCHMIKKSDVVKKRVAQLEERVTALEDLCRQQSDIIEKLQKELLEIKDFHPHDPGPPPPLPYFHHPPPFSHPRGHRHPHGHRHPRYPPPHF